VTLADYLAHATRTPFALGRFDCCLWLADWVLVQRGGPDPAEHLRGQYMTPRGYGRFLRQFGGVLGAVGSCARAAGLAQTLSPKPGDIGVVSAVTTEGFHDVGAIRTARGWASLSPTGLLVGEAQALAAWSV
jgi:hypothetical protein